MKYRKGFSIIEVLISITLISIIGSAVLVMSKETKTRTLLQDSQAAILYSLEQARNKAASGVGEGDHGVRIESDKIITFEGSEYTEGTGKETSLPSPISTDQTGTNIIFDRLEAKPNTDKVITISHPDGKTKTLTITESGIIAEE